MGKLSRPFFKTPKKGADTIVYLASSDKVKNISGQYFENRKEARVSEKYDTIENEEFIWNYSEQQTGMRIFLNFLDRVSRKYSGPDVCVPGSLLLCQDYLSKLSNNTVFF